MRRETLNFHLPKHLIAQKSICPHGKSRLLVLNSREKKLIHAYFWDLHRHLKEGDTLVLNNSEVVPSRLWGVSEKSGQVEVSLVNRIRGNLWEALVRPQNGFQEKEMVSFKGGILNAQLVRKTPENRWQVRFRCGNNKFQEAIKKLAEVNTPFYLRRRIGLKEYQNIYARIPGSIQAPTAGLHFTKGMLDRIKKNGVEVTFITLHIGGSALPVTGKDLRNLSVYREYFEINSGAEQKINQAKRRGGKVIGVGTTVVRALETAANEDGTVNAMRGWTELTIRPGHNFKVIDGFLTNFHLPGSSHLLLTCAFGTASAVLTAYKEAIKRKYKFLDFGDGMLIL